MHPSFLWQIFAALFISSLFQNALCNPVQIPDDMSWNPSTKLARAAQDPSDQSWIRHWAAVGDSYASGLGSGTRLNGWGDYFCSRYDQSYPYFINADYRLGDPRSRTFTFYACSGAKTDDVTYQLSYLSDRSQDVITVSAGGNDANLAGILNECIFQWMPEGTAFKDECTPMLNAASKIIDSSDFHDKLDSLVLRATSKLKPGGTIYWVGYNRFFGVDDNQCDKISWAYWYDIGRAQYLTLPHRQRMNLLVRKMNMAIQNSIRRAGEGRVEFVDYDKYFQQTVGRFCESGYPETQGNRVGLLMYEYYTSDDIEPKGGFAPLPRSGDLLMNGTFEHTINAWAVEAKTRNSSLKPTIPFGPLGKSVSISSVNATHDQILKGWSSSWLPDSYTKVFHLRPSGNSIVSNLVLYKMQAVRARKLRLHVPPEEVTRGTCPARFHVESATHSAKHSATPTNSFQLPSATSLPPRKPYSGVQPAVCNKITPPNSTYVRINRPSAQSAAAQWCRALVERNIVLANKTAELDSYVVYGPTQEPGALLLSISYNVDSCPTNHSIKTLDFGKLGQQGCEHNIFTVFNQSCAQDPKSANYDPRYTLLGGSYGNDCGLWSMLGTTANLDGYFGRKI